MTDAPKGSTPKIFWVAFLGVTSAVSAIVARRAVERGWVFVTGSEPPKQPADPDTPWPQAFGWAVASMVALEGTRLLVTRRAARYWRDRTGALPPLPGPQDKKKKKKKGVRS